MNIKDMTISMEEWTMDTVYNKGIISKSVVHKLTGSITFFFNDGTMHRLDITEHVFPMAAYLHQFGITVTEDGKYFFVQSWESGLYCFELMSGKLIWKSKRRHPFELFTKDNTVTCRFFDQCLDTLTIETGEIIQHYPLGYNTSCLILTDDLLLVGPKRNKYHIIDTAFNIIATIPYDKMNLKASNSFVIREAALCENGLRFSGFESVEYDHKIPRYRNTDTTSFERFVEINLPFYLYDGKYPDGVDYKKVSK